MDHKQIVAHVLSCDICIRDLASIESFMQKSRAGQSKPENKRMKEGDARVNNTGRPEQHDPNCLRRIAKEEARRNPHIPKFHYVSVACTCGKGQAKTWRQRHNTEKGS